MSKIARSIFFRLPNVFYSTTLDEHLSRSEAVIFAHAGTLRAALPCFARLNRRPYTVCWLHGREAWGDAGRDLIPLLRQCDRLVAVSHHTADAVSAMMPGSTRPDVVHNPVDTTIFSPLSAADAAVIRRHSILTVGRHDADSVHKGYDVLIEAMALLRDRRPDLPLKLTITGTGQLLDVHRDQISRLALGDRVLLAGRVSREALINLYRTTDVFAFPSRVMIENGDAYGEGFGLVNIEAAACGRPVITSTHGGCPETIVDGVTGYAVDPTSAVAVASAIERMFALPPEERDRMGLLGCEIVAQRFSVEHFQQRVNTLLATTTVTKPFPVGSSPKTVS
jgi:phosphatidylinositol alpha-1,6-mannosyltransferase